MKKVILWIFCAAFSIMGIAQEQPKSPVKKVYVIFKTHFDLGYTDLSSAVEQRYVKNFIPQAVDLAEQLRAEGGKARYVWTTGSWLIDAYLRQATPQEVQKLEKAIERGDIVWNAAPYSIQSESAGKDLFEGILRLSANLDAKYGKKTIAAKMTDVPGHTRSIITPLYDAGIRFLHIGVNNCSTVPVVPYLCRWQNTDGKEIILMYQDDYGTESILPDGQTVVSLNFTGDNNGPHTAEQVKAIYEGLQQRYPQAEIIATSLNDVAEELQKMVGKLPVLTSEIGDTWIYGYASSPLAMARYRALMRLYSNWLQNGKWDKNSDTAIKFAVLLGLFAEHTWGIDHLVHLKNWDKYEPDAFNASRDLPEFRFSEKSWQEKANRIDEAIALLPPDLKQEALEVIKPIGQVSSLEITKSHQVKQLNWDGSMRFSYNGAECILGQVAYQTYSADDYNQFIRDYVRCEGLSYYFTKPGLEKTKAQNATIVAKNDKAFSKKIGKNEVINCLLSFPSNDRIDSKVLPQQIYNQYIVSPDGKSIEMTVSLVNKPAVRLPEAYWVSFFPADVISVFADKMGMPVDVLDVVKGGNRQMHGIDNYIDIVTGKGVIRITSLDAPVVSLGERKAMNYSLYLPDLNGGIHFCLFNNLWTTNFSAWWEGSLAYRFKIEYLPGLPLNYAQSGKQVKISKNELENKIKGGWAGQTIGVSYGSYTEFRYNGTFIQDYQPIPYREGYVKELMDSWPDLFDDIYMDLTFVDVFEKYGIDASVDSFANAFAYAGYNLWHANQAARYNIINGIKPPLSGHWMNNPHADDIDYQIEADFAGLMNPGMPNSASAISDKIGHIMNYGDGWYGGVYVGAMYSLAFVSDDINYIVSEALKTIPAQSAFYQCINDVVRWHKKYPEDWKQTWFEIQKKWSEDIGCPEGVFAPLNIDAKVNAAYIVLGLLYGQGDFTKTLDIATRAGQDSDCNPSSAGGVLGTMIGYDKIPEYWMKGLRSAEDIDFKYTAMSLNKVYNISMKHALKMIERSGGKVAADSVVLFTQKPQTVQLEKSFEGLVPVLKQPFWRNNFTETEFEFEGTGFALRGEAIRKSGNSPHYVFDVAMYIDGIEVEKAKQYTDYRLRRYDLFWKYNLPQGNHTVKIVIENPHPDYELRTYDYIVYKFIYL